MCKKCNNSNCQGLCQGNSLGKGSNASQGLRGPRGFQGPPGPPGPAGVGSGTPGPTGPMGPQGVPGPKGNAGAAGAKGDTGPAPTLSIGTVTQSSPAAAQFVQSSPGVYALNLTLPKGDTGAVGPAGTAGQDGIQGNPGSNSLIFKKGDGATLGTFTVTGGTTYASVSVITISHACINGYGGTAGVLGSVSDWLEGIVKNSYIQITDAQNSANFGIYKVNSFTAGSVNTVFTVTLIHANGNLPAAGVEVTISYNIPGQDAIPVTTGGNSTAQGAGEGLVPVGIIVPWPGKLSRPIPTGWLLCDGSIISQTTYGDLYAEIGDEYNLNPVSAGMFSLPNLIDAIPYGGDNASIGDIVGTNAAAITVTGTSSTTISIANLPEHTHSISGLTTGPAGSHFHTFTPMEGAYQEVNDGLGDLTQIPQPGGSDNTSTVPDHTHTISGTIGNTGTAGTTTAAGTISGTGAGDNRQKGISMRWIIKY
ncbi:MAG: hypothetical protein RLY43_603 [Bacteroidota bacterium]|jgi:hypothetical protein